MKKIHLNRALAAKKKKLTILFALLCASMMGFATTYCHSEQVDQNGNHYFITIKKVADNTYSVIVEGSSTATITGTYNVNCGMSGGIDMTNGTWIFDNSGYGKLTRTFEYASTPGVVGGAANDLTMRKSTATGIGDLLFAKLPTDADWNATCGGSSKPSPELSLNATSKTLEIDASAETFQIVASKLGTGAISYASSAEGVATVSNTGLVTAVSGGTATITITVAEDGDYAEESKTLTVEVIDWPNTDWLENGTNAYKLHISPAMGGTQRINNGNLWIEFPDALIDDISIEPNGGEGAWRTFAPSNFTGYRTQFTAVWRGNTYTFTVYRNFTGVNLAKGMPSTAGRDASNAWKSNDGNKGTRWGSKGAKHYSKEGDLAEDWWVVDLGAMYEINAIKTLYEGATPKNYSFYTSPNNDSWIEIDSYNAVPQHVGNTDADYNEYTYSPGKVGRYVKIFAREAVQADFAYGISIWEFEVYGQPAENVDINAPVLASAAVSGTPTTSEIKIAVSASDTEDGEISLYRVRENSLKMDRNFTAVDGKLTFSGLVDDTDYSFTITALDNIGNQSNAIVVNASTAVDPSNPATMAPEPPVRSADDVRAIYSDAYADILMHDFTPERTDWGSVSATRRVKGGNNYLLYDISSGTNITWGSNDGGANAIVAKDGYHAEGTGLDASGMEYLHVDIWSLVALKKVNVKINDAVFTTITHDGGGWQSYDLEKTGSAVDFANIRWLKLDGITSDVTRGKAAVDNYYFWKAASGVKAVVVSSNNGSWGSATAKVADEDVTSVPTGTEVTFAAAAETGYDFAYWQIGETKVYDNPYVVEVDANITAVATFEPSRTPYCAVPVTNAQGHTIYLTVKKTNNANEFMILLEGSSDTHITNVYDNIQFRLTHVNGSDEAHHFAQGEWTVNATGYGSAYTTFTATDFRAITIPNQYIPLVTSNSGADEFYFPTTDATIIKWDATCTDAEAPVLAAPVATPLSGTSVRLALSATDNMAAMLTYTITYEGLVTPIEVPGASGETTYYNVKGLSAGTNYTFTVTVSDGANVSASQSCSAIPSMPTAPVPTHNAVAVRSVYSDTYESALAHDFQKDSWHGNDLTYTELNIAGDHNLLYDLVPYNQDAWFSWGAIDGANAIVAKDGFNDGEHDGLDASGMDYMHIDIWSVNVAPYAEVQIMDSKLADIPLAGTGWQSFDLPLAAFKAAHPNKIADINHMKFIGFRGPNNPEQIAIDNVYFWQQTTRTTPVMGDDAATGGWATFSATTKVAVPSGLTAYKATYSNEGGDEQLVLDAVSGAIPANEGVLLRGEADHVYTFSPTDDAVGDYTGNALVGCPVRTDITSVAATNDIFCLRYSDIFQITGFYLYSGQYIAAGKAYLPLPKAEPSSAPRRIRFVFREEQGTTGFDPTNAEAVPTTKFIENGQLYIRRGDAVYTIQGVRVK